MSYPQNLSTACKSIYNKTLSNCYQTVINAPASRKRKALDLILYAGAIQQGKDLEALTQNEVLSSLKIKAKKIKIRTSRLLLAIIATIAVQGANSAYAANYSVDHLKLYAHSRILNWTEFQCFNKIITKESRWSYTAKNGSHYGLGQMRSEHYRDLDPYRMIDASLGYISKRYSTNCKAWAFHEKKGYY